MVFTILIDDVQRDIIAKALEGYLEKHGKDKTYVVTAVSAELGMENEAAYLLSEFKKLPDNHSPGMAHALCV